MSKTGTLTLTREPKHWPPSTSRPYETRRVVPAAATKRGVQPSFWRDAETLTVRHSRGLSDDWLRLSRAQRFTTKGVRYMSNFDKQRGGQQTVPAEESNGTPPQYAPGRRSRGISSGRSVPPRSRRSRST